MVPGKRILRNKLNSTLNEMDSELSKIIDGTGKLRFRRSRGIICIRSILPYTSPFKWKASGRRWSWIYPRIIPGMVAHDGLLLVVWSISVKYYQKYLFKVRFHGNNVINLN